MRRFLILAPLALVLFMSAAIPAYAAANLPLLDPNFSIVPAACQTCPCDYGGFLQLIQNLMNAGVALGIIAFVFVTAYAGASFMLNPTNPESRTKARSMLLNVVVGMVILLTAWLVVDFIMKMLYDETNYGPWNSILAPKTDGVCIQPSTLHPIAGLVGGIAGFVVGGKPGAPGPTGIPSSPGNPTVGKAGKLCADGNPACSISSLKNAGLSDAQAQAMSCIAVTESSGNPNTPNSSTGACGTFQITTRPGNWSVSTFHQSPCSTSSSCNNAACNLQTAVLMYKKQGYQPWTGKNPKGQYWNPNAVACVNKYNPT